MKAQSNNPISKSIGRWKEGEFCYYYNHKDNGEQAEEGRRYEAEFVIIKSLEKAEIEKALARAILDPEMDQKITDNIQIDGKKAIDVEKDYIITKDIADKIAAILIKTPIDIELKPEAEIEPKK